MIHQAQQNADFNCIFFSQLTAKTKRLIGDPRKYIKNQAMYLNRVKKPE